MATPIETELSDWALLTFWFFRRPFDDSRVPSALLERVVLTCIAQGRDSPTVIDRYLDLREPGSRPIRATLIRKGLVEEATGSDPRRKVLSLTLAGEQLLSDQRAMMGRALIGTIHRSGLASLEDVKGAAAVLTKALLVRE